MSVNKMLAVGAAGVVGCVLANAAQAQVRIGALTTTMTLPSQTSQAAAAIDFANARPMRLPAARILPPTAMEALRNAVEPVELFGASGASEGGSGDGELQATQLAEPRDIPQTSEGAEPEEFGTSGQPYTTSQANALGDLTVNFYPFRASGKLFFKIGANSFLCSASLIKPGVVVTAAHCVANFGQRQFYSGWTYVPAYNNGSAPYGSWTAKSATILTAYFTGTDSCAQAGVICADDVAVLTENPQNNRYPGNSTGWFGYGWNGYGFNGSSQALISQLGYPVALDGGLLMERTDSQGFTSTSLSNNTIIGSLMTGGSSGGPWLVNLGTPPALSGGITFGSAAQHNTVVGVTSWGYTNQAIKQQGASPFTSGNIVNLVNAVCTATPGAC